MNKITENNFVSITAADDLIVSNKQTNKFTNSIITARAFNQFSQSANLIENGKSVQHFMSNAAISSVWRESYVDLVATMPLTSNEPENTNMAESIIGIDDRKLISDTLLAPWCMICQLVIECEDGVQSHGTGWFISPRTVMTAGHCVYEHRDNLGWVKSIEVIPGMNGHWKPFESVVGTFFQSVSGWTENQFRSHDYGCILLPKESALGEETGWLGFASLSDDLLQNLLVNNGGYPADKTYGTLWFDTGRLINNSSKQLQYELDTSGGQSGSPIWRLSGGQRHVVGVHAYGGAENKSTRIDKAVFKNMMNWKRLGF